MHFDNSVQLRVGDQKWESEGSAEIQACDVMMVELPSRGILEPRRHGQVKCLELARLLTFAPWLGKIHWNPFGELRDFGSANRHSFLCDDDR